MTRRAAWRTTSASVAVTLAAGAVFWWSTDGLRAFTAEAARRERVMRAAPQVPRAELEDQEGRRFTLDAYRGRRVAVEFIYTRCVSVCQSLGTAFRQIRDTVPSQRLGSDFALLSLSFDPTHDDPAALKAWAAAHGADGESWRVARVTSPARLHAILETFGVIVIPDGLGGYEHNAAIHLLDRGGRLVRISDIDAPQRFVAQLGFGT